MKKIYILLVLALLSLTSFAEGDDPVIIVGICYQLIGKDSIAEVVSSPNGYSGDIVIPSTVTYEGVTYDVKKIGDFALSYNENATRSLTSVVISEGITSIGE